jgi:demethylmenaquinone methyltransferase/2-methoxy-6-polyprenyl-1,4-benzoquinol methylase
MVLDLESGEKIYDCLGRHPTFYRFIRWSVCFGREHGFQKRALRSLKIKRGETVLDLGCGNGVNFPLLEEAVGATGKIIALDYSSGMLDQAMITAAWNGWRNIKFIQADAARVNLPDNSLDGAVCTFAFSAMPGEDAAIRRVAAALKPGAQLVVLDAKAFTGLGRILNPVLGPIFKHTTNWNYKKDVIAMIRKHFNEVEVSEYNCGCNYIAVAKKNG